MTDGQKNINGPNPEEIENLLDQVEKKYFKHPEAKRLAATSPKDCDCTKKQSTNWEEVDEMLKDFKFEDSNPFSKSKNKPWARQQIDPKIYPTEGNDDNSEKKKCYSVYLGGSFEDMGYCVPGAEKTCDKLMCLRCDFPVVCFDNFMWDQSVDYLFLRNNMPDFAKLHAKLIRKKGFRAYACQCQHISVNKILDILSQPQIRWVCKKHSVQ